MSTWCFVCLSLPLSLPLPAIAHCYCQPLPTAIHTVQTVGFTFQGYQESIKALKAWRAAMSDFSGMGWPDLRKERYIKPFASYSMV